jgi:hypothetical protein
MAVSFRNALARCGVTQAEAQLSFPAQGYPSMTAFARLSEEDVEKFVKTVNKLPAMAGVVPQVPFGSIKNLQAMRHYVIECTRLRIPVVHNNFTPAEMDRMLARMDFEAQIKVNETKPPPLPDKFVSFTKWRVFSEGFAGHCSVLRGCMNIPLSYLLREHDIPTDDMRTATYSNSDNRLLSLVMLEGDEFSHDNIRVWDLLRPLIYNTAAWDYVKNLDKTKDGRKAFHVLMRRGEGNAARSARRSAAEDVISKAQYTGKSKRFTLHSYINLLQGAFTELAECGEPYSEEKKVEAFIKGLVSDRMQGYRTSIIQNDKTRLDFQEAYAFVETMEGFNAVVSAKGDGFDRNVSGVAGKSGGSGGTSDVSYRSKADWDKLPLAERKRIQSLRDKTKPNKKAKVEKQGNATRKLAELAADTIRELKESGSTDESSGSGVSQGGDGKVASGSSTNPANQFGRKAHAVVRFAESLISELGDKKGK